MSLGLRGLGMSLRQRGSAAVVPFVLSNNTPAKGTLTQNGAAWTYTKTGADGYDASAIGTTALTGDFILRVSAANNVNPAICGVGATPAATNDGTIDYAVYFSGSGASGAVYVQTGGTTHSTPLASGYVAGTYWFIKRTGTTLSFGTGGSDGVTGYVEKDSFAAVSGTLYFDSCIFHAGDAYTVERLA